MYINALTSLLSAYGWRAGTRGEAGECWWESSVSFFYTVCVPMSPHQPTAQIWMTLQTPCTATSPYVSSPSVGCSLMEQKTDWLKETSGEIVRKLHDREKSAHKIRRCVHVCCMGWTCLVCYIIILKHIACVCVPLDAGWWSRRLTRCQQNSPENSRRGRIQLSRLRGVWWGDQAGMQITLCAIHYYTVYNYTVASSAECCPALLTLSTACCSVVWHNIHSLFTVCGFV